MLLLGRNAVVGEQVSALAGVLAEGSLLDGRDGQK